MMVGYSILSALLLHRDIGPWNVNGKKNKTMEFIKMFPPVSIATFKAFDTVICKP
jgi:hypothetical protein